MQNTCHARIESERGKVSVRFVRRACGDEAGYPPPPPLRPHDAACDALSHIYVPTQKLKERLEAHIKSNTVKCQGTTYVQKAGIPQVFQNLLFVCFNTFF